MSALSINIILFLVAALYAAFLERWKHRWEPDLTWLEVVVGTALCLAAPFAQGQAGLIQSWLDYQNAVWISFVVGGAPVVIWQIWRMVRSRDEALKAALTAAMKGRTHGRGEALAETGGGNEE